MTTRTIRNNLPDDAPASAFAPTPIGAYRRGLEDRRYDGCYFNAYGRGTVDWWEYEAGWRDAKREARSER
jgi:hypothetical protein